MSKIDLTEVPEGWSVATIADIADINPGLAKTEIDHRLDVTFVPMPAVEAETGRIDVSNTRKFREVKKGYTPFQEGDVLFAKITPCMENGKMAVVPALTSGLGFGSTEFHVLRPRTGIEARYIYYFISSLRFRHDAEHNMTGAVGQRRVPTGYLGEQFIFLPPAQEQHRIVSKIEELFSELDSGIQSLEVARAQLKVYRQAVLRHAFEGRLTTDWREKNQGKFETADQVLARIKRERATYHRQQLENRPAAIKDWEANGKPGTRPSKPKNINSQSPLNETDLAELPPLPAGWKWVKWEDILAYEDGAFKRGPFGSALKKSMFVKSGLKVYEQYCPINDDCSFERYYITETKFNEMRTFAVRANDFLISCSGVTLGRITQVPDQFKPGIINQALLRVRVNHHIYMFDFFKSLFRSHFFQQKVFTNSTGTAIPNVKGVRDLKAIPVPLCSIEEQREIMDRLSAMLTQIDTIEETIHDQLLRSNALRQSILDSAFSGRLVSQDQSDEPASNLLDRIKAKKCTKENDKKKNGRKDAA